MTMRGPGLLTLALAAPLAALPAGAVSVGERCGPGLTIVYSEAAPRDFVVIRNESPEGWRITRVVWRLARSEGALIFDTESGGPGVDSAHPFIQISDHVHLADLPLIRDGETTLALDFVDFAPGAVFEFSIDLDDTALGLPDTIVDGGEILGAEVEAEFQNEAGISLTLTGIFGTDAEAVVETACTS